MRRHHTGSGRREVIPADWSAHHAGVAQGAMSGTVALRQPGTTQGAWDPDTDQVTAVPHPPYATLPCRVQALAGQARVVEAAADEETTADYLIAVPLDGAGADEVAEGHLVHVTASGDPALDGRTLRVVQVVRGTQRFERDLFCELTD